MNTVEMPEGVSALEVVEIARDVYIAKEENRESDGTALLHVKDGACDPVKVNNAFLLEHNPKKGDFIACEDGEAKIVRACDVSEYLRNDAAPEAPQKEPAPPADDKPPSEDDEPEADESKDDTPFDWENSEDADALKAFAKSEYNLEISGTVKKPDTIKGKILDHVESLKD